MPTGLPRDVQVAPSILSADFARLGEQVREVLDAGARVIHCDVMDGHFVLPITIGPLIVGALADQVHGAGGLLDVHLMIERPERQVPEFARAGADNITFHFEATPHANYTVAHIKEAGCQAGVALTPSTPVAALADDVLRESVRLAGLDPIETGGQALAVIAMGKLGGGELNYSSDIDIMFVGEADARKPLAIARQAWKVDVDLRPEGLDQGVVAGNDHWRP